MQKAYKKKWEAPELVRIRSLAASGSGPVASGTPTESNNNPCDMAGSKSPQASEYLATSGSMMYGGEAVVGAS
jgi:hypothetical protein